MAPAANASCSPSVATAFLVLRTVRAGCAVPEPAPCAAVLGAFCIQEVCQYLQQQQGFNTSYTVISSAPARIMLSKGCITILASRVES